MKPTVTLPTQLADEALDFLYELRGEWKWKQDIPESRPSPSRNQLQFTQLVNTIEQMEKETGRK